MGRFRFEIDSQSAVQDAVSFLNGSSKRIIVEGFCADKGKLDRGIFQFVYAEGKYVDAYVPKRVLDRSTDRLYNGCCIVATGYFKVFLHENIDQPKLQFFCEDFKVVEDMAAPAYTPKPNRNPKRFPDRVNKIAVITSRGSAGYGDFKTRIGDKLANKLVPYFVSLIGSDAVDEISDAIYKADRDGVDVICVVRGGGDTLGIRLVFDSEEVCEAIIASKAPVYVAVGHSDDLTYSDLVSDAPFDKDGERHYFATPTELAVALRSYYEGLGDTVYVREPVKSTNAVISMVMAAAVIVLLIAAMYFVFVK